MSSFDTKVTFETITSGINKSDSAIKEAIANSIDAKSQNIYINVYEENVPNSVIDVKFLSLDIADDGEGIPTNNSDFEKVFCRYNVSTKDDKSQYGKKGKGRYTYLTLTKSPDNMTIYTKNNNKIFKIFFKCKEEENIKIYNENYNNKISTPIDKKYTTLIQFKNLNEENFNTEKNTKDEIIDDIKNEIISFFADRIASKSINIYLNNKLLIIDDYLQQDIISKKIIKNNISFSVDYYIWNEKIKLKSDRQKHILFFNDNKILKGILPSGRHKLSFNGYSRDHSIVVKSKHFNNLGSNEFDNNQHLFTDNTVVLLKKEIELEIGQILLKIYKENIDKISDEYITYLDITKDEITQNVYHSLLLPFIEKFGNKRINEDLKSIIVKLIDTLASESPDTFINNLKTILSLNEEESQKVEYIQQNYGIIKAITEKEKVIKKVDFLNTFDDLVNGKNKKSVQERTELHKVVEKNLWLINEKFEDLTFSDIISDKSIQTILENKKFYQFNSIELEEIIKHNDIKKIPDIFIPIEKNNIIYIIELKKPGVQINRKILDEIEDKYVKTIKNINKNFQSINKRIIALAISDDKTDNARARGNIEYDDVYIEPKSWMELIEDARARYNNQINELDNKLKSSQWQNLDEFILSHKY